MNFMDIDKKYRVLTIGPWTLYDLEDRTYIFILGEVDGAEFVDDDETDNYIIVENVGSIGQAVKALLDSVE